LTKRTSRSAPFSLKLALFSFSASDDIRKHSIGNDGFLSALSFGYGDVIKEFIRALLSQKAIIASKED
jgi:hypothetical protein